MQEFIKNIIFSFVGDNAFLGTLIASMFPMIEARGSIPLSTNSIIFSTPISIPLSFLSAFIGSSLMTILLLFLFIPFFKWLKKYNWFKNIYNKIENKISSHNKKLTTKKGELKKYIYLCLLCALPIPLTGYYTSCLVAGLCNLKILSSFISIVIGNILCMCIISLLVLVLPSTISIWIFYLFLIIFIVTAILFLFQYLFSIKRKNN